MGVINDGTVSGNLLDDEVFAVQYPGYPSSVTRAVQTLGGIEAINKARKLKTNRLELHFRPEDPHSHPAFGELRSSNSFLLRISRKKFFDGQSNEPSNKKLEHLSSEVSEPTAYGEEVEVQMPDENHDNLSADIVARVSEAYHFDGMVDYQHVVASHADVARRKKRTWSDIEEPCSVFLLNEGLVDLDHDDLMMILPPLFSPKDMPENLVLRPSGTPNSLKSKEGIVLKPCERDIESGLAIDFTIKEIPEKVNWEEFISEGSKEWQWQRAVSKLFDERPIWPKNSIIDRLLDEGLQLQNQMLKRLLLGIAYYFSNGPFLKSWIRKGYDPRKDPESRIYQTIDFRVKDKSLQSYCEANAELKLRWRDVCSFKVFPTKCSTLLQLYELDDDYIQQEIRKPSRQATCSMKEGWFSKSILEVLRKRIQVRFLSVYPGTEAKKLLKSTMRKFVKLKSTINKEVKNSEQEEHHQVNKGVEDKELDGNEDEEPEAADDDEDKMEVDDSEEEYNAYEADDMAGEDDEISLQQDSFPDLANNSTIYLQDLFGGFPSAEVTGDKLHGDGMGDEEYEIYEQESDYSGFDEDDRVIAMQVMMMTQMNKNFQK